MGPGNCPDLPYQKKILKVGVINVGMYGRRGLWRTPSPLRFYFFLIYRQCPLASSQYWFSTWRQTRPECLEIGHSRFKPGNLRGDRRRVLDSTAPGGIEGAAGGLGGLLDTSVQRIAEALNALPQILVGARSKVSDVASHKVLHLFHDSAANAGVTQALGNNRSIQVSGIEPISANFHWWVRQYGRSALASVISCC